MIATQLQKGKTPIAYRSSRIPARIEDATPAEYLDWVDWYVSQGRWIPQPETREQYLALLDYRPDLVILRSPEQHKAWGLPSNFGRVESFTPEWMESFLATLATDDGFRSAVRNILNREAA